MTKYFMLKSIKMMKIFLVNYPPLNEWVCKLNLAVYKRSGG